MLMFAANGRYTAPFRAIRQAPVPNNGRHPVDRFGCSSKGWMTQAIASHHPFPQSQQNTTNMLQCILFLFSAAAATELVQCNNRQTSHVHTQTRHSFPMQTLLAGRTSLTISYKGLHNPCGRLPRFRASPPHPTLITQQSL